MGRLRLQHARQAEKEARAETGLPLGPDLATVALNNAPHYRQAITVPSHLATLQALEGLKQLSGQLRLEPSPVVLHFDDHLTRPIERIHPNLRLRGGLGKL